jgi:hypothetical protein
VVLVTDESEDAVRQILVGGSGGSAQSSV